MQQTEQSREQVRAPEKQEAAARLPQFDSAPWTLALQAVQAGVPLTRLPPALVLALSGRIGNAALLDLAGRQTRPVQSEAVLPPGGTGTAPAAVPAAALATVSPPAFADWPALQAAPAPAACMRGGEPFV